MQQNSKKNYLKNKTIKKTRKFNYFFITHASWERDRSKIYIYAVYLIIVIVIISSFNVEIVNLCNTLHMVSRCGRGAVTCGCIGKIQDCVLQHSFLQCNVCSASVVCISIVEKKGLKLWLKVVYIVYILVFNPIG